MNNHNTSREVHKAVSQALLECNEPSVLEWFTNGNKTALQRLAWYMTTATEDRRFYEVVMWYYWNCNDTIKLMKINQVLERVYHDRSN